jgi:glycosyltransferase involved in cell wall biosynthesis
MRILFVADGRSPTSLSWLRFWVEKGHDVHLITTYPCGDLKGFTSIHLLPIAFGSLAGNQTGNSTSPRKSQALIARLRGRLRVLRYYLGPLSLAFYRSHFNALVAEIQPDLVHALRIPFEGMLAAGCRKEIPLIISTWGNDLTLHAQGSRQMADLTRRALSRADGLISDTQRDIRLSHEWGFAIEKPTLVVPGSGGIRLKQAGTSPREETLPEELADAPIVVNPRGQRPGSLRQDIFFQSIPIVLEKVPQTIFVCPSLKGDIETERWVDTLGIGSNTKLWPRLNQEQLWTLFEKSQVFVSPSVHDGTPNSLLEAMALGCFPVVGETESMVDWVQNGINGLLVDATEAQSIAEAVVQAINKPALRKSAAQYNATLIAERAAYEPNMIRVERFYELVKSKK